MKVTNISANGKEFNPAEVKIDLDKNPHIERLIREILKEKKK